MKAKKRILISLLVLVVFLLSGLLALDYWFWAKNSRGRILPRTNIGNLNLSGKTYSEALNLITSRANAIQTEGLKFKYHDKEVAIAAATASFDSDLSYQVLSYDPEATTRLILGDSWKQSFGYYLLHQLNPHRTTKIKAVYTLDADQTKNLLIESFKELNIPAINAYFSLNNEGGLIEHLEIPGKEIGENEALQSLGANLDNLDNSPVVLTTHSQYPTVTLADLKNLEPQAKAFVGTDDLILRTDQSIVGSSTQSIWLIKPERLITWLGTEKTNDRIMLTISQDKIRDYLLKSVAPFVNLEPTPPRFMIQNGKVISWQNGLSGRQIDATTTAFNIARNFLNGGRDTAITIQELANEELLSNNDFKIKEIVGTGHSQFTGSPPNRIHNIKVGAAAMSGLLIKPGEEFSLVKNLGDVDATSTGYLPELVIKGNKTTPEFGGGLCQIGTTIFRAALSSGLPITYRQNHSYRVSYYEPAGMDAAVYIPKPDVRFINDTGNYILIQSRIVKNDLYFDFWGVKDGRTATTTTPVIYNIVKPEPMKTIISTDLAPGQKKCTESSHNGADVYFDYTVTYPEGVTTTPIQGRRFKSHYVPWQAICLIGATSTASSTLGVSPETGAATSSNQKAAESSTASSSTP